MLRMNGEKKGRRRTVIITGKEGAALTHLFNVSFLGDEKEGGEKRRRRSHVVQRFLGEWKRRSLTTLHFWLFRERGRGANRPYSWLWVQ